MLNKLKLMGYIDRWSVYEMSLSYHAHPVYLRLNLKDLNYINFYK